MKRNIILLGYGRMGKEVEAVALERGHEITLKIRRENPSDLSPENLKKADVAIDFSLPEAAPQLIQTCLEAGVPVVSGTTGWLTKKELIESTCQEQGGAFLYASNFSIGVNLFFAMTAHLAQLMNGVDTYGVRIEEIHHTGKKDAPSGTAISLAHEIIDQDPRYKDWVLGEGAESGQIPILAHREPGVPGTHTIDYHSPIDTIQLKHEAHNRKGFALGAVMAAEFIIGKQGLFDMNDVLKIKHES